MEGPRQWKRAKLIWLSLHYKLLATERLEVILKRNHHYQASSMAVKCSAAFSTRGTRIRPMKLSGTPLSTMDEICSTRKYAESETSVSETAMARILSKRVSFGRKCSFWPSSSLFSSFSRTSSKMLLWVRKLYHRNLISVNLQNFKVVMVGTRNQTRT